ncbi:acyl carrier protein phosphodiesterase [Fibrella aquatica]|uniref:acyl carrier protein phosphodiesterase n=1 Tax=Fibrella aquatica TaxID=3242487 RepID=UPI003520D68F
MNLLAHAWLSDKNDDYLIGNFIGDFIKGDPMHPRHGLFPAEIDGIRIHRAIDSFTDSHEEVQAVRTLLYPRCHKYAGVAVDVFFDHFLATQFKEVTGDVLDEFVRYVYATLHTRKDRLPLRAARMAHYMMEQDWLRHYQTTAGIDRALSGLARRTQFPSGLDTVVDDLVLHYDAINLHFLRFWPLLKAHIVAVRESLLPE